MNFEIVKLEQRKVVGNRVDTTYADNKCYADLPATWGAFLENGIYTSINNKVDQRPIGLYFDQKMRENGILDFSFMSCCHVSKGDNPKLEEVIIPESNYAKFVVTGQTPEDINNAWETIAKLELDRNTGFDFEVYNMDAEDPKERTLECYVSIK